MTAFLIVQGYDSCNVILNARLGGLGLCNKSDCPIFKINRKERPCSKCDYRVLFHDSGDKRIIKVALSMAGLFFDEHIKFKVAGNHYSTYSEEQIIRASTIKQRIDFGTRIFMYKILIGLQKKYSAGIITVDTSLSVDFDERLGFLARLFVPVNRGKIKYKPKIYEK